MNKSRLEAFSDGVFAILITIMVLELHVPKGGELEDLIPLFPTFVAYILSYVYIGIYWNNHHHMLQATQKISGTVMWANMHLLFWLSLVPFMTGWMGENHFSPLPTALYGFLLLMASLAYWLLQLAIIRTNGGKQSVLARAVCCDWKGSLSPLIYMAAIGLAFYGHWISQILYTVVALIWLVPDRRIERTL